MCRPMLSRSPAIAGACTFEDFVVGASNRLAAPGGARTSRSSPAASARCLFTARTGCGKSHLLQAIGHHARRSRSRVRVLHLTAEQFTSQFLEALERRALPGFRQKTRHARSAADRRRAVPRLARRRRSKSCSTRSTRCRPAAGRWCWRAIAGRRTASDSAELACAALGGLAVAIDPPDYATRVGIVRAMAARMQMPLDDAVIELVAQQVVGSGRLLSGAINRLVAASMAHRTSRSPSSWPAGARRFLPAACAAGASSPISSGRCARSSASSRRASSRRARRGRSPSRGCWPCGWPAATRGPRSARSATSSAAAATARWSPRSGSSTG